VLRAKIDMAAPNITPGATRRCTGFGRWRTAHGRTWCIYPMYDYAHTLSTRRRHDAFPVLAQFRDHRPLYDCSSISCWKEPAGRGRSSSRG